MGAVTEQVRLMWRNGFLQKEHVTVVLVRGGEVVLPRDLSEVNKRALVQLALS